TRTGNCTSVSSHIHPPSTWRTPFRQAHSLAPDSGVATSFGLPFASLLYLGEKMSAWLSFLLIERYGKVYLIFLFSVHQASQVAWRVYSPCLPSSSLFSGCVRENLPLYGDPGGRPSGSPACP